MLIMDLKRTDFEWATRLCKSSLARERHIAQRTGTVPLQSMDRTEDPSHYGGRLTERDLHTFRRRFCHLRARGGVWVMGIV